MFNLASELDYQTYQGYLDRRRRSSKDGKDICYMKEYDIQFGVNGRAGSAGLEVVEKIIAELNEAIPAKKVCLGHDTYGTPKGVKYASKMDTSHSQV